MFTPAAPVHEPFCDHSSSESDSPSQLSPRRRAREATLAKAREHAVPLKVRTPEGAPGPRSDLNPHLPAKKRVVFEEFANMTAQATKLEAEEPVKKRPTEFLLQDVPRVMRSPPG